ncbi:MAG: transporter [Salinivenus sp.]
MPLSRLASAAFALLVAATLSLAPSASAQISADRPGFGDGTATVAPGTFQAGLGYAVNGNGVTSHELGQLFLRYGVTDALELRGGVGSYVAIESPFDNGYNGTGVGAKLRLFQNETSALSGVATLGLPTGTGAFDTVDDRARQTVKLAYDGALGEGLTLSVNGGASFFYTDDSAVEWLFIPTLSFGLTETTGAYVGYAGFYDDGPNANWVEGGLTLLANPDTQLDVNTGLRVDDNGDDFFVGLGVAHRF